MKYRFTVSKDGKAFTRPTKHDFNYLLEHCRILTELYLAEWAIHRGKVILAQSKGFRT